VSRRVAEQLFFRIVGAVGMDAALTRGVVSAGVAADAALRHRYGAIGHSGIAARSVGSADVSSAWIKVVATAGHGNRGDCDFAIETGAAIEDAAGGRICAWRIRTAGVARWAIVRVRRVAAAGERITRVVGAADQVVAVGSARVVAGAIWVAYVNCARIIVVTAVGAGTAVEDAVAVDTADLARIRAVEFLGPNGAARLTRRNAIVD
jgi:hypothetical protein